MSTCAGAAAAEDDDDAFITSLLNEGCERERRREDDEDIFGDTPPNSVLASILADVQPTDSVEKDGRTDSEWREGATSVCGPPQSEPMDLSVCVPSLETAIEEWKALPRQDYRDGSNVTTTHCGSVRHVGCHVNETDLILNAVIYDSDSDDENSNEHRMCSNSRCRGEYHPPPTGPRTVIRSQLSTTERSEA